MYKGYQETPLGRRDQFEATKKWKTTLRKFYVEMPLMTHRRQLRYYPDCFTGKDAVDCVDKILPSVFNKNCSRESARRLLEYFLQFGYLLNVREEACKSFCDNATLYRFCNERMEELLSSEHSPPKKKRNTLLMRSSSVRESTSGSTPQGTIHLQKSRLDNLMHLDECGKHSNLGNSNRLSISCQDLSMTEHQHSSPIKRSGMINLSGLVGSIGKASASLFSLHRSNSDSSRRQKKVTRTFNTANPKALDDSVFREGLEGPRVKNDKNSQSSSNKIFASKSVFQTKNNNNIGLIMTTDLSKTTIRQRQPPKLSHTQNYQNLELRTPVFTEADEFKFWQNALIIKFKQFASCDDIKRFMPMEFSGADVRWNCRRISTSTGVVQRLPEQNCELHRDLLVSIRRLGQWNSSTGASPRNPHELFSSIKSHLSKLAPIIPREHVQCMLNILDNFSKLRHTDLSRTNSHQNISIEKRLHFCIRFCSLTLHPQILRNLQILCKCLRQIWGNKQLMQHDCWALLLSEKRRTSSNGASSRSDTDCIERNRNLMLRSLCDYFIDRTSTSRGFSGSDFTGSKSISLFKLIVEFAAECLINVPRWLEEEVQRQIATFDEKSNNNIPMLAESSYCERIDQTTYEIQSKTADKHLLALLDQILTDENLNPTEKFEQLKRFRISYPSIYMQRFPSSCEDDLLGSYTKMELASTSKSNVTNSLTRHLRKLAL